MLCYIFIIGELKFTCNLFVTKTVDKAKGAKLAPCPLRGNFYEGRTKNCSS
jgi:hypothetical protein